MQEDLRKKIEAFLKDKRDGNSDYAPVTDTDLRLLNDIMYLLLRVKFVPDCDGDLPVTYNIVNKHTHQQILFPSIKRTDDGVMPLRELNMFASLARWANDNVSRIVSTMEYDEINKGTE